MSRRRNPYLGQGLDKRQARRARRRAGACPVTGRIRVPVEYLWPQITGAELEADAGTFGFPGLHHPGCDQPAGVSVALDCAYCPACGLNVRIPGAWVIDQLDGGA